MKIRYLSCCLLSFLALAISTSAQTTYNVCCGEVFASGSCTGGVPHSNAGVFNPPNLSINVGDRIRFYTRMELLGGYNGTHDIRFTGSPANNVLLPISTNILMRVTNVTTPPFAAAGTFPMECVDANHCFAYADLFSGWPCTGYGVTVNTPLDIPQPELYLVEDRGHTLLTWDSELEDATNYYIERAGADFGFQVVDSVTTSAWQCPVPLTKTHFRVAAVNEHGDMAYTNVVSTEETAITGLLTLPNPFSKALRIGMKTGEAETVQVEVADVNGALIHNKAWPVSLPGFLDLTLETEEWSPGVYMLRLRADEKSWTRKVVKL
jgi:hypothetical protein